MSGAAAFREGILADVRGIIDEFGWAVQGVFPHIDSPGPAFAYTVGLTAKGLPELWIDSLAPHQARGILNALATSAIERGGLPLEVDVDVEFSVPFRLRGPIDPDEAEAFVATAMYESARVVQVLWPDADGRWPGEAGYDAERFSQRLIGLDDS